MPELIKLKDAQIGDVIQLYVDSCLCCIRSLPSDPSSIVTSKCFKATILKKEKDDIILIGWKSDQYDAANYLGSARKINKNDPDKWKKQFDYVKTITSNCSDYNVSLISRSSKNSSLPITLMLGMAGLSLMSLSSNNKKYIQKTNE